MTMTLAMIIFLFYCRILFLIIACCNTSNSHITTSSLLNIQGRNYSNNKGGNSNDSNNSTKNNISFAETLTSIQILGKTEKKIPTSEILVAIRQCEKAQLKPKNDEMAKGECMCVYECVCRK